MAPIVITSENLITNRKARDMIGFANLTDSYKETLAIIRQGLKEMNNPKSSSKDNIIEGTKHNYVAVGPQDDPIPQFESGINQTNANETTIPDPDDGNTLQLNVKLFLREYSKEIALEAISYLEKRLSTCHIDNVYVTVPANAIAHIGLSSHSSDTEPGTASESEAGTPNKETPKLQKELDPDRAKYADDMINLWNTLSNMKSIKSLGLCDVETDIFKTIYNEVQIKPKNVQVNLKSCCVVPPELKEFANVNNIRLLTHSDSPEFLGDAFCAEINDRTENGKVNEKWKPLWIIRFQVFKKMRGVLQDKRYMIALEKDI